MEVTSGRDEICQMFSGCGRMGQEEVVYRVGGRTEVRGVPVSDPVELGG